MLHTFATFLQKQVIPRASDVCLDVFDLTKRSIHVTATWIAKIATFVAEKATWIAEKTKEKRV